MPFPVECVTADANNSGMQMNTMRRKEQRLAILRATLNGAQQRVDDTCDTCARMRDRDLRAECATPRADIETPARLCIRALYARLITIKF